MGFAMVHQSSLAEVIDWARDSSSILCHKSIVTDTQIEAKLGIARDNGFLVEVRKNFGVDLGSAKSDITQALPCHCL